jgi:hypothetical protein
MMAPKKHSITVRIPKGLNFTAQEESSLKKAYKTHAVRVLKSRKGHPQLLAPDTNVITVGAGGARKTKKSSKATTKKKR